MFWLIYFNLSFVFSGGFTSDNIDNVDDDDNDDHIGSEEIVWETRPGPGPGQSWFRSETIATIILS